MIELRCGVLGASHGVIGEVGRRLRVVQYERPWKIADRQFVATGMRGYLSLIERVTRLAFPAILWLPLGRIICARKPYVAA